MTATNSGSGDEDASSYAHLPSGQRLYHLLLSATQEQVVNSREEKFGSNLKSHYPILAELWTDVDEIALSMLDADPEDPAALDYQTRWKDLDNEVRGPSVRSWMMCPWEARERLRTIKRFMLRAGPLSLRRRKGESSSEFWNEAALEYR